MATSRATKRWLAAVAAFVVFVSSPIVAHAIEYEVFVEVDDEADIYDLFYSQQISEATFNDLIEVMRRGVDLSTASREDLYALPNVSYDEVDRILAYRAEAGGVGSAADLVAAEVLDEQSAAAIAAFIRFTATQPTRVNAHGVVRYRTVWTSRDRGAPPMAVQGRVRTLGHLSLGIVAVVERTRLGPVRWDPNREGLNTRGRRTRPRVPKYFAQWDTPSWGVIAGTYTVGFGQRLVLDNSGRYTPNGFYLDDVLVRRSNLATACRLSTGELQAAPCTADRDSEYIAPDYSAPERLRGVAAGIHKAPVSSGWMQAYGVFSYQTRALYQYGVWNKDACDDPRVSGDIDPHCSAPAVYQRPNDPLAPAPSLAFSTLPNMYSEILGGGNVSWFHDPRTHVGITGYAATTRSLIGGANLDLQESERLPSGGPFGAVGADMAWGHRWSDLFVEVAHSFDSVEHSEHVGGPAVIARHAATWSGQELETSVRYYDHDYANPYARSIAGADQTEGIRARDEAGARLRYTGVLAGALALRTALDVWSELGELTPQLQFLARGDFQATPWWRPGLWLDYRTRNALARGRHRCFDTGSEYDRASEAGGDLGLSAPALEPNGARACSGERVQVSVRSGFRPHPRLDLELMYRHNFSDDSTYDHHFRQDSTASIMVSARPVDALRLRLRVRYDNNDILDNARLEHTLWTYLQLGYTVRPWFVPSVRYDLRYWADARESTAMRRPNPEHWLHFEVESRF